MQREMRKAVQSIEFIKNASHRHPELFEDGMKMLHQVLAVMPAVVTAIPAPGDNRYAGDSDTFAQRREE